MHRPSPPLICHFMMKDLTIRSKINKDIEPNVNNKDIEPNVNNKDIEPNVTNKDIEPNVNNIKRK